MKKFVFSAAAHGDPEDILRSLLDPQHCLASLPYVRKVEVLEHSAAESLITSWEVEIDGVLLRWVQEDRFIKERQSVQFQMVSGDFLSYSGEWTATTDGEQVKVSLSVNLDWGAPGLSQFVARILERKAEKALRGMVLFVCRAARRQNFVKRRVQRRFGFVFHPLDLVLLAEGFGDEDLKSKRPDLLEHVMAWFPPFRRGIVTGIRSPIVGEIEGDMILLPLLPKQMLMLDNDFVLSRLLEACRIAERYGDKIIGLGAYAANVGKRGAYLARHTATPVTTGSSYTIAVAMEATLSASELVGIRLDEATVAVIGASGTIGRVCSRLMAERVRRLILVARNQQRLQEFARSFTGESGNIVTVDADINTAISNADVVIVATNTPTSIIDVTRAKSGAIICDVSRPRNVAEKNALQRQDILVIDGGVVRPPGRLKLSFSLGLDPQLVYACMAEAMILTLEGRYESYSLGGNVNFAKVQEIAQLGRKHGFVLGGLRSFDREVSLGQIERIRLARRGKGQVPVTVRDVTSKRSRIGFGAPLGSNK